MEKKDIGAKKLSRTGVLRGAFLLGFAGFIFTGPLQKTDKTLTEETPRTTAIPLHAPHVSFAEAPALSDSKALRLSYKAFDISGVTEIALRLTPTDSLPGADHRAIEVALPVAQAKEIRQTTAEDMGNMPWAGQLVILQIVATNAMGQKAISDPVTFTLPERHFFHPVARVLLDERDKLLKNPDNESLRDETANIMAGIAHETLNFRDDPVVMMALRAGAVRLVLNHDRATAISVNDILWETAIRIENGAVKTTLHDLSDINNDLSSLQDLY